MTDQCLSVSRVLPSGVILRTGLLVATWLLTTDHHSGWSVPRPLCRLICWWSLGYWPPITFLGDRPPDLFATWSTCHPASGPRGSLMLMSSTTDDRSDHTPKNFKTNQNIEMKVISSSNCLLRNSITYNLICSRVNHTINTNKKINTKLINIIHQVSYNFSNHQVY